jgi:NADPH2:quinone reductase
VPEAGEALVRLEFAALNPADRFLVEGLYPTNRKPPFAVGRDGCGVVEKSSGRFREGDRVVVLRSDVGVSREGTLAEFVTVPEESLAPLPDGWSSEEGAAGPLVLLTAWQALVDEGELKGGQTVLVTGASGGVGIAAVILAKALGACVVALSRSETKRAALRKLGADVALDSEHPDLPEAIKQSIDGGRIDVVVENLGGDYIKHSLEALAPHGRICLVGLLAGRTAEIPVGLMLFKRARVVGVHVGDYTAEQSALAWRRLVEALAKAGARPIVDRVFDLEEVPDAFAHLDSGPMGKVLIRAARGGSRD